MSLNFAFLGGILFVGLLAFIAYKVKESQGKKGGSGSGGGPKDSELK